MDDSCTHIHLKSVKFISINVTPITQWVFANIADADGVIQPVEITCGNDTKHVAKSICDFISIIRNIPIEHESQLANVLGLKLQQLQNDHVLATAISALRTAIVCLQAVHRSINVTEILSATKQTRVPIYANINRSLFQGKRSPGDFSHAAEKAVALGFSTIKCAPFDEVKNTFNPSHIMDAAKLGLKRVALIRDNIGEDITLLVDCHGRFTPDTAILIAQELYPLNIGWLEEPVIPMDNTETLAKIAQQIPIPLAGGESGYGKLFFDDLIHTNATNIVMPDIKFCGGIVEAYKSGQHALQSGAQVSLHNPSGPVSQLASAHVTAAMTGGVALEYPVEEADWRTDLMHPPENVHSGFFWLPTGAGLGASLNNDLISHVGITWEI